MLRLGKGKNLSPEHTVSKHQISDIPQNKNKIMKPDISIVIEVWASPRGRSLGDKRLIYRFKHPFDAKKTQDI